jgi:plastocyanin
MNRINVKIIGFLFVLAFGMFLVQGCGSKNKSTNPTPPPQHSAHYHAIAITNSTFSPASLTIPAGDTVVWTNDDGVTHTVTSDSGSELSGSLGSGQTYQHIFMTANTYAYHCTIHTFMHGSVTVQ